MQRIALIRALLRRQHELLAQCTQEQQELIDEYVKYEKETRHRQQAEQIRIEHLERLGHLPLKISLELNEPSQSLEERKSDALRQEIVKTADEPDGQFEINIENGSQRSLAEEEEFERLWWYAEKLEHVFLQSNDQYAWRVQESLLQRLAVLEQVELDYRRAVSQLELYLAVKTGVYRVDPQDVLSDDGDAIEPSDDQSGSRLPTVDDEKQQGGEELAKRRQIIAQKAMQAVIDVELALGHSPEDVSEQNRGYDILSRSKDFQEIVRHIEVKGRVAGKNDIRLSRNELVFAVSNVESYILAIVIIEDDVAQLPRYLRGYKFREPDPLVLNVALSLKKLLELCEEPS